MTCCEKPDTYIHIDSYMSGMYLQEPYNIDRLKRELAVANEDTNEVDPKGVWQLGVLLFDVHEFEDKALSYLIPLYLF